MYRIRFHGRGGQGIKTASRMLGSAFFLEGFEVQDAPRYGAERRGAPIFATVRAAHEPIHERGAITRPDLALVADDTLVTIAAAGVLAGVSQRTVLLLRSAIDAESWRQRLKVDGLLLVLPDSCADAGPLAGAACAGAAARLLGVIPRRSLEQALRDELAELRPAAVERNLEVALAAFETMAPHAGCVAEGTDLPATTAAAPDWIDFPFEEARISAPDIHGAATSVEVRTGLWRTMRPVIDQDRCRRCHWVCSTLCPDGVISVQPDGHPSIDYEHCKGCMVCVAVCPPHAIRAVPESSAREEEASS